MGILIHRTKRTYKFTKDGEKTVGYTVKAVPASKTTYEELLEVVMSESGMNKSRCTAVIEALIEAMVQDLRRGHAVQMGNFGTFRTSMTTKLSASPGEVSQSNIQRLKLIFTPGKAFRSMLKNVTLELSPDNGESPGGLHDGAGNDVNQGVEILGE